MIKLKKTVIVTCILFSLIILPWLINPLINNLRLFFLTKQLMDYTLPAQTEVLENDSVCGKLNGNGNGMDFLTTILIKSDLSLEELQKHYSFAKVIEQKGRKLDSQYLEHGEIYYSELKDVTNYENYFVVMIYDSGHPALFDIRGS